MWIRIKQKNMAVTCTDISQYSSFTLDQDVDEDGVPLKNEYVLLGWMKTGGCTVLAMDNSSVCHDALNRILTTLKINCMDLK